MKSELVFGNRTGITIAGTVAGSSASDSAIFFCNDSGGVAALLLWTPLQMIHLAQAKLEMFSPTIKNTLHFHMRFQSKTKYRLDKCQECLAF